MCTLCTGNLLLEMNCLLCGRGTNTTEHWLTACVVTRAPLFIVLVTLGYAITASLGSLCRNALPIANANERLTKNSVQSCLHGLPLLAGMSWKSTSEMQAAYTPTWSAISVPGFPPTGGSASEPYSCDSCTASWPPSRTRPGSTWTTFCSHFCTAAHPSSSPSL